MNETIRTLHSLHTTHGRFSPKEVPDRDLEIILDACVRAASASARQSYSVIVIDDKDVMKEHFDYTGSKALLFCVDFTRLADIADYLQHPYACGGLQDFITGSTDTILAAQNAAVAATSLGISTLFTNSVHRKDLGKLHEAFKLPGQLCFPLITLILGYSEAVPQAVRGRLKGPGVIHYSEYKRLDTGGLKELVQEHDRPETQMGLEFFKRDGSLGYERYLDWFYSVWSKPKAGEIRQKKAQALVAFLKDAGFLESDA